MPSCEPGDAELLATDDELSIWNAIENKGMSVQLAVERWLKKRAEDIKRDEKWETNRIAKISSCNGAT
jgi:hypothetical protein